MSNKTKYFLDTSVFMELFKNDQNIFEEKINEHADGRRFAAFYTAIELNRGFLQTMVMHYKTVSTLQDVASAQIDLSNQFGSRIPKRGNILEAYMLRFSGGISNDYRLYLGSLEGVIFDMTDRANQLVKHFVGHFKSHALASLELYGSEDYDEFLHKCSASSSVDLEDFWLDNDAQLYRIRNKLLAKNRMKKAEFELFQFIESTMAGKLSDKYRDTSDFVISLECPKGQKMIAGDHSFELFMPLQGKIGEFVRI